MHSCACNFHFHTSPRRSTTTAQFVDVSLNRLLPRLRGAAELADSGRKTAHQEHDQTDQTSSVQAEERLDEEPEIFCRADPEAYRNRVDEPEAEEQELDEEEEEEEDHREELEEEVEPEEEQRERRQTHEASRTIRSSASSAV